VPVLLAAPPTSPAPVNGAGVAVAKSPLVYVRGNTEYLPVRKRVRFGVPYEWLASEPRVEKAVQVAMAAAIRDHAGMGFEYEPGLLATSPVEATKATVRNFLRRTTETGVRAYGDESEETDAQVLPHISRDVAFRKDPGRLKTPDPVPGMSAEQRFNYRRVCDAIAAVERGAVAQDVPAMRDMVDIRIRLPFRQRLTKNLIAVPSTVSKGKN